ncbi:thioredoxin-like protein [Galdieria sulphuraria]|uniref:Thioredoxin-like protein n=1 Tax=Galdieria sulphuraria TaxID=130081 RepID=M2X4P7_GALSU|nr:thioredoxin-like protein [Galdieria sulphuraria]EME31410.1 thioredoxin-like protein [Galdieria sulphuraria]|eukprot:XP_005707930.1 thioredoxin-like protein [Galdieria sulphuraria]
MASNWPPLPRQPIGTAWGPRGAPIQMEVFLDYCCPFSKKAFFILMDQVLPAMEEKICFYFQHQIQPWHPQSTLLHEAALAVKQIDPDKFYPYSRVLFENLDNFIDQKVYQKSRKEMYEQLAKLAKEVGIEPEQVLKKLEILDTKEGNDVTADLKLSIRYARQLDIHVSPTFMINRMKDPVASSSWSVHEWKERLSPLLS